jgi:cysteinyl-tRNA synthetase
MKIFNSLTNNKEEFKTIEPKKVKMYVCGPTVYNYIHIGNARPVIFFDVVRRYFDYIGYDVTFVSNITDVDDKIIKAAIENNITEQEVASRFTQAFLEDVNQLNCKPFDINPKVTEYMDKIIDFIHKLVDKGYAYEVEGDVYFRVNHIKEYGQLSNQETEHLEVGARITEHSKKENPLDFTLWKKTTVGIQWDSPWGMGRPGWHTECVAMIHDTLGEVVDIHGGGSDLKFPHHENEIAQSQAIANTNLANYWLHNGRLMIDNEKMSKSLGNFIRLKDFLAHFDYRILRLFMLSTHYRQPLNYTEENIDAMAKEIEKIEGTRKQLQFKLDLNQFLDQDISGYTNEFILEVENEFKDAMEDDFNTPNAITALIKLMKEINKSIRKSTFSQEELNYLKALHNTFNTFLNVLGINFEIEQLSSEVKDLIKKRDEARQNKDFELADKCRNILQDKGINI